MDAQLEVEIQVQVEVPIQLLRSVTKNSLLGDYNYHLYVFPTNDFLSMFRMPIS